MEANNLQSYYIRIHMGIQGTSISSDAHCIDLKDPEYRFFTSANTYCPPGTAGVFGQQASQQPEGQQQQPMQVDPQLLQAEPPSSAPPASLMQNGTTQLKGSGNERGHQQRPPTPASVSGYRSSTRSRSAS